jgi:hypothetical protein
MECILFGDIASSYTFSGPPKIILAVFLHFDKPVPLVSREDTSKMWFYSCIQTSFPKSAIILCLKLENGLTDLLSIFFLNFEISSPFNYPIIKVPWHS